MKEINVYDNIGIEVLIKSVKKGKKKCSQPNLLLDFIIAEKIKENAEK